MNKRQVGSKYERVAVAYLESIGYKIICLNYRCRIGEIDIIAMEQDTLVFCEVKYRKTNKFGSPAEAVDLNKQNIIRKVAEIYMMKHGILANSSIRFDIVAILDDKITLYRNGFGGL